MKLRGIFFEDGPMSFNGLQGFVFVFLHEGGIPAMSVNIMAANLQSDEICDGWSDIWIKCLHEFTDLPAE